ncbi:DUF6796 family protein [Sorangium sp. So ce1151]|uniref:DUF6796 family protein n=1 Tax=Sorangium sp. So ce1151 TaxID=3133332 RepID=UPI003F61CFD1
MDSDVLPFVRISGLSAALGSLIYAVGDVLLLAPKVGPTSGAPLAIDTVSRPELRRRAALLANLSILPPRRLIWGGLIGVFAAPLVLAGVFQIYQGLRPAGVAWALPPALLFAYAIAIGPFVHGSFIYLGETAQALRAGGPTREVLFRSLQRQHGVMQLGYAVIFLCTLVASFWFSAVVASGRTAFPTWMAAVNPVVATLAWLGAKRALPQRARDCTEGAGFNIAYVIFFALTTATLW